MEVKMKSLKWIPGTDTPWPRPHFLYLVHSSQYGSSKPKAQYIPGRHMHLDFWVAEQFWAYCKPLSGLGEEGVGLWDYWNSPLFVQRIIKCNEMICNFRNESTTTYFLCTGDRSDRCQHSFYFPKTGPLDMARKQCHHSLSISVSLALLF